MSVASRFKVVRVSIYPISSPCVSLDFHRLDECRGCLPTLDELDDLGARHRVTFDRRRVVDVVEPDFA
jgi:hypothetical protein